MCVLSQFLQSRRPGAMVCGSGKKGALADDMLGGRRLRAPENPVGHHSGDVLRACIVEWSALYMTAALTRKGRRRSEMCCMCGVTCRLPER